jgi:hypothetical protein
MSQYSDRPSKEERSAEDVPTRIFRFTREHWMGGLLWALLTGVAVNALSDYLRTGSPSRDSPASGAATAIPAKDVQTERASAPSNSTDARISSSPLVEKPPVASSRSVYVNATALRGGETLVHIVDAHDRLDHLVTADVARALGATGGAFTPAFGANGAFGRSFDGDDAELRAVDSVAKVPLILLGRIRISYSSNEALAPGLRKADVVLDWRTYRPSQSFLTRVDQLRASGAGFSDRDAGAVAVTNLVAQLKVTVR